MEKQIDILTKLTEYNNRQVVINHYDEEETLFARDGFNFETIQLSDGRLIFSKQGKPIFSISLTDYPNSQVNQDFSDYYSLYNQHSTIRIYFPH